MTAWRLPLRFPGPCLRMLKQLGREVQEAEVKINQFEKALKGLQRVLEVEEGEHRST